MEDEYLKALMEMSKDGFNEEKWLIKYFELYKSTLNWPDGLPPINRCNLIEGTLRDKFNSTYSASLSEFDHKLNYETKTLVILN
ncbi:MAG: hypothetical protein WCG45_05460 [bacterium]